MSTIILRQVGISTPEPLFQNLNLTIGDTDRIGLVAGNGGGKTSLLRCIGGLSEPTDGTIVRSRGMRLGYVAQTMPPELLDLTLFDAVHEIFPDAERDENAWRVDIALDGLETPAAFRTQPVRTLSGGWQRLALIARASVVEPDALLLDEPTNHLDLEKIRLLETWINDPQRQMPVIVASHDRSFLDACTTHTLFLRPAVSKTYSHPYSRARQLLAEDDAADATQLDRDMKEADRLRKSANELKNIGINKRSDAAQKKSKHMAQRADDLEQSFKSLHEERPGLIRLDSRDTHARVVLSFDDCVVRTPDDRVLFRTRSVKIFQGERVVVQGPNGVGKSLFIGLIHRAIGDSGAVPGIQCHPGIVLGYADQAMTQLPDAETPFGYISTRFQLSDQRSRSLLAAAGFPVAQQMRPIGQFSLGQKARLGMLTLRLIQPNFYLLDEPTNHVDIPGQETLESEILAQDATCILVSHDRSFVRAVGTRYLKIERGRLVETETID